jgi:hypothetical protein
VVGSEPRKHHVIPGFYLAGFTQNDSLSGRLNVFDHSTGKRYRSSPRMAYRKTDFYRIDEPGVDPNVMEKALSVQETVAAPYVKIVGSGGIADKKAVGETLEFAAVVTVRSTHVRKTMGTSSAATIATKLRKGQVTRDQWEQLRAAELRHGAAPDQVPEYEEAIRRLLNTDWYPRPPHVPVVGAIFEVSGELSKILRLQRRWEAHVTDDTKNGGFITSASPLAWGDLETRIDGHTEDIRDPYTEVTFPVSRKVALVSYPMAREGRIPATDGIVARINARTLHLSGGMIFYAHDDFLLRRESGEIRNGSEYFAYDADARRRGIINP